MTGGLALAILRYDEGDGFNRSGVVTEAHAMTLQLLAAVFRIPGGSTPSCVVFCKVKGYYGKHCLLLRRIASACPLLMVC